MAFTLPTISVAFRRLVLPISAKAKAFALAVRFSISDDDAEFGAHQHRCERRDFRPDLHVNRAISIAASSANAAMWLEKSAFGRQ